LLATERLKRLTVFATPYFIAHTEHKMSELREWQTLANKELSRRGKTVDALVKQTAEGIAVKPLYTEADIDNLEVTGTLPGLPPYVRGPRATMYTAQPWTIRQYAGFSTAKESNAFYRRNLAAGQKGLSVAFDLATIGAMTPTILAWRAT